MAMTPTSADVSENVSAPARRLIAWKHSPLIVGTISTNAGLSYLIEAPQGIDLVEVRLDLLLANGVAPKVIQQALAQRSVPALLTLRTRDEGGAFNWRSRQRVLFFMAFIRFVDAVDLELTNLPRLPRVLRAVRLSKRDLIVSSHSLRRKLTPLRLRRLLSQFRKTRASLYKIVGLARHRRDLRALAEPLLTHSHMRLAIMATGPLATASRLSLPALGSRLVYVHLDGATAPGQPSYEDTYSFPQLRPIFSPK